MESTSREPASPSDSPPESSVEGATVGRAAPGDGPRVQLRVQVPPGACLEVEVEAVSADGRTVGRQSMVFSDSGAQPAVISTAQPVSDGAVPGAARGAGLPFGALPAAPLAPRRWVERLRLASLYMPALLFWLALGIYAFTRLVALPDFPIYFFTDEAIQTVQAADLLRDRFHSITGEFLPTFFENGSQFNLGTSVYLQVLPYLFFGKSIWVTRGVAALATLLAAASVGLILKRVFKSPYPWLAVMFLAVTPAWFLHSRTAFETGLATTFYAAFLYCYLLYRRENPRYLFAAVLFGALAFYSYSPMRMVMLVSALLLFFSDLGYHLQHRKTLLLGVILALLLAVPFARFLINHPGANDWQMRLLGSYWITDVPMLEKLQTYAVEYLRGLDIFYWYLPHSRDLPRHTMLDYGHLLRQTLPLGLAGVGLAFYRIRNSAYRTLLIALFAAPSGAALVQLGITRVLVMVIPMAILTALAASEGMEWLHRRRGLPRPVMALAAFILLAAGSLFMLRDALVNGPLWFDNYTLTGQQWGARQIFSEIRETLRQSPQTQIMLSPSWANGTDVIARFFFNDPLPFQMGSAKGYYNQVLPLDENRVFIMTPEEFVEIPREKFSEVKVDKILPYPDGRPGFYFVRLKYVENIQDVITVEEQARHQLDTQTVLIDGSSVTLNHSKLDMGEPKHLFDGDEGTLIRSWALNPLVLDFELGAPREMSGVSLLIGGAATTIRLEVWEAGQAEAQIFTHDFLETPRPREAVMNFGSTIAVQRLRAEVLTTFDPPDGHVHLWEVRFIE